MDIFPWCFPLSSFLHSFHHKLPGCIFLCYELKIPIILRKNQGTKSLTCQGHRDIPRVFTDDCPLRNSQVNKEGLTSPFSTFHSPLVPALELQKIQGDEERTQAPGHSALNTNKFASPCKEAHGGDGLTTRAGEDISRADSVLRHPHSAKPPQQRGLQTDSWKSLLKIYSRSYSSRVRAF